jgi:hypothetical protein
VQRSLSTPHSRYRVPVPPGSIPQARFSSLNCYPAVALKVILTGSRAIATQIRVSQLIANGGASTEGNEGNKG